MPNAVVVSLAPLLFLAACRENRPATDDVPTVLARQLAPDAIRVDGVLEAAWERAGSTGAFVHPGSGAVVSGSPVNATARIAWDARRLLCAFVVRDRHPTSPFPRGQEDPHIWARASGVELMVQPGDHGDNRSYFEVQVDVNGAVWDTRFDDYNQPITGPPGARRFGHQQWRSRLERAVKVEQGRAYTLEIGIPWDALRSGRARTPPGPGDTWRMNLYSFRDGQRAALAWSPILGQGNFHRAARFGRVRFVH
jgi:hypothetical protein